MSIENLDKEIHENLDDEFGQICAILCSFPRDNSKDREPFSGREHMELKNFRILQKNISYPWLEYISFYFPVVLRGLTSVAMKGRNCHFTKI